MFLRTLTLAAAAAAAIATAVPAFAEGGHFIPVLSYRTGPYAPNGVPFANGYVDYFEMLNFRDGGVGGVPFVIEECETGYKTDRGVECYDRLKENHGGAVALSPWSTGTTYALIEKASQDKIPILSMGYGRTSAADGRVFPWIFNFPATYWSQASSMIAYIGQEAGGLDKLKGKKITLVHFDHPAGREPIPTLELLAEKYGYKLDKLPVALNSLSEQKSTWLQVRKNRPDYVLFFGWGVMNSTGMKEASAIRYPMDKILGWWWSGTEADVLPAAEAAKGYKAFTMNGAGSDYPVFKDLKAMHDAGKGVGAESMGEVLYNRGLVNAAYIAEAIRIAQAHFNKTQLTGEDVRWGLENLDLTPARIEEMGMTGLIPPTKVTCANHEGTHPAALVQQWDGEKWNIVSDWVPAMSDVVRPLIEQDAALYAKENNITPRSCS
ncbi:MAG: ABC transporter substrate-binding protein [Alphaproteobacteria bacterium]|nr:ABC transporter substrate-binding protein [Alphaproteobacteria bacterium]MCB9929359.1 ABC transporter substrate-binding protein [Alphaproteobacteria bacterium]